MLVPAFETLSGLRLSLATPPAVEPVSLDEAKLHCRVEIADDDALLGSLIVAARQICEAHLKRSFITTVWDLALDGGFPISGGYYNRLIRQQGPSPYWLPTYQGLIELLRPPLQSVQWVKYVGTDGQLATVDPSLYLVGTGTPGRIQPVFGQVWPIAVPQIGSIQIRYTSGYGDAAADVPGALKAAIKLLVSHLYENREAVVVAAGYATAKLPFGVEALLATEDWGSYS